MQRAVWSPALVCVIGASFLTGTAAAQGPEPGARIRLTLPCHLLGDSRVGLCRAEGTLMAWGADTLLVAQDEATRAVPLRDLERLQASRGTRTRRLLGAGVGFVVGAGATFLVLNSGGSNSLCDRSSNQDAMNSGECLGLTVLGGVAGAGLGALVGGLIRSERWEDVPLPGRENPR